MPPRIKTICPSHPFDRCPRVWAQVAGGGVRYVLHAACFCLYVVSIQMIAVTPLAALFRRRPLSAMRLAVHSSLVRGRTWNQFQPMATAIWSHVIPFGPASAMTPRTMLCSRGDVGVDGFRLIDLLMDPASADWLEGMGATVW